MEMCRVCLSMETGIVSLDQSFVNNYNLLTNLNIALTDGLPQFTCGSCLDTLNFFIDFRAKCVSSETKLQDLLCTNIKSENYLILIGDEVSSINKYGVNIKEEIKLECTEESLMHDGYETFEDYEHFAEIAKQETKPKKSKLRLSNRKRVKKKDILKIPNIGYFSDTNKLFCGICTQTFDDKNSLHLHLESHNKDKYCGQCAEHCNSWSQLLGHRLIHIPTKQRHCHICSKRFMSSLYLEHHYRIEHMKGEGIDLTCRHCSATYVSPIKLKKHMWSVHGEKKYICDHCCKQFKSKSLLSIHIVMHTGNKAYVCDICGYRSKFLGGLKDHKIRRHTVTKVNCKDCHRPFSNQQAHDKHKCNSRVVMCPVCGIQYNSNMNLRRHMNSHSDVPKYECDRCPARFKTKCALKAHQDRHDGNKTKQCEYCPAKFYTGSTLIKHRRTHTGEKPYVCKVCNKGFTGNNNLKVHMKVHGEYNLINKKNKDQVVLIS